MDWGAMKWYRISGYNGYEYNFDHKIVRSIKNYKVNPMGKLIKKYNDTKGDFYKMSNMQNEVCKVYISEIEDIIKNDPHKVAMATNETNLSPRNTVTRKKYRNADNDPSKDTFFPDFSDLIEG